MFNFFNYIKKMNDFYSAWKEKRDRKTDDVQQILAAN